MPLSLFASRAFVGRQPADALPLRRAGGDPVPAARSSSSAAAACSASGTGLVLLPVGLLIGLGARPAGALADRLGVRGFLVAGSTLVALAAAWLALALPGLAAGVIAPLLALRRRHDARRRAADHRGHERRPGRPRRRRLGRQQHRQPARRPAGGRAGRGRRGADLRRSARPGRASGSSRLPAIPPSPASPPPSAGPMPPAWRSRRSSPRSPPRQPGRRSDARSDFSEPSS